MNSTDVLVIGGGIAALCSAISASEHGAKVTLVDSAPKFQRGGNARHSRNLRIAHDQPSPLFPGQYGVDEYMADLNAINHGAGDPELCQILAKQSAELPDWFMRQGLKFETIEQANLPYSRKTAFFLGGGRHAMNALFTRAETLGVEILQETTVTHVPLHVRENFEIVLQQPQDQCTLRAASVIICSGGYQANLDKLREDLGPVADHLRVRGSPWVTGALLSDLLAQGAKPVGRRDQCHAVAVHADAPLTDGGIVTRADGLHWGIVINKRGERFFDEAKMTSPHRYSYWGQTLLQNADGPSYLLLDADGETQLPDHIYEPVRAHSLTELASAIDVDPQQLQKTVSQYHDHIVSETSSANCHCTATPRKSRFAMALKKPPFSAYALCPGITFTGFGIQVDGKARVCITEGGPCERVFAAGMIMAPAILGGGYTAGAALAVGAVFGRIAGQQAAVAMRH
ncbi:tricarballylate dehydrogenase [Ectothiorhodosinus mongolicus]|uniref:Tricarballylate dehydrogenase n=1 Tax=Ectothiorhodosinus mongolicus TaxID=233100 RepID=A0A1R3W1G4_9GAMM|nr:FAD-dependent tricarballylate dehydrogenase TcuA [Ectothiorhodosinus mongolicus]ULX57063.1 FAD-dependent tricarballylate dehydrogenase TcuA [Ectothiorhodosinus mongolicus]SIT69706.1 tricarballylate dehydrogenase [Ectothiorhodosinus mongolicus]